MTKALEAYRILSIDTQEVDIPFIIKNVEEIFGLSISYCHNLESGLKIIEHDTPDLIFLELNQLEDLHRVQAVASGKPVVVMLDAHNKHHLLSEALDTGADDFLIKNRFKDVRFERIVKRALRDRAFIASELKYKMAIEESEKSNAIKNEFLASISHDLRTPLNGIVGAAQLLFYKNPTQNQQDYLNSILACSENLLALIDSILDSSVVDIETQRHNFKDFALTEVFNSCLRTIRSIAQEKDIKLKINNAHLIENRIVFFHEAAIRKILLSLLSNAVKFTDSGHVVINIKSFDKKIDKYDLVFEVEDTGIGLSPQKQAHVLELKAGNGLGLSITKKIIGVAGGTLGLTSQLGQGCTFSVTLPLTLLPDIAPIPHIAIPYSVSTQKTNRKILLVDDLVENRFIMCELIKHFGFEVDEAQDGQQAIELAKTNRYDDIFMDMRMPIVDGFGAVSAIRRFESDKDLSKSNIVAVTASTTTDYRYRCFKAGCDEFISKPVTIKNMKNYFDKYKHQETVHVD